MREGVDDGSLIVFVGSAVRPFPDLPWIFFAETLFKDI